jgi:hypothetical protein
MPEHDHILCVPPMDARACEYSLCIDVRTSEGYRHLARVEDTHSRVVPRLKKVRSV